MTQIIQIVKQSLAVSFNALKGPLTFYRYEEDLVASVIESTSNYILQVPTVTLRPQDGLTGQVRFNIHITCTTLLDTLKMYQEEENVGRILAGFTRSLLISSDTLTFCASLDGDVGVKNFGLPTTDSKVSIASVEADYQATILLE